MSEELRALEDAVRTLLRDHAMPERLALLDGRTDLDLWEVLEQAGLTRIGLPESGGGSGGTLAESAAVLRLAGGHACPVPLAESSWLAGWLLDRAGLDQPTGPTTTGPSSVRAVPEGDGWRLHGTVRRVPAADHAQLVVVVRAPDGEAVVLLGREGFVQGQNVAGQSRDDVLVDVVTPALHPVPAGTADELELRGATTRALLISGALDALLPRTVEYARQRVQFGRPLAAFQAVQQQVAELAAEAAAAGAAADAAVAALASDPSSALVAVAAAKVRTAQAAGVGAAIAHQVHGALGMTREHSLRFLTTSLWSWRAEWGSEALWSERVADAALEVGAAGTWPLLVGS